MRITAREVGRRLQITVGGPDQTMEADEAAEAEAAAIKVWIPPVTAGQGTRIWALYAGVLFNETEDTPEVDATTVVEIATGCYIDPKASPEAQAAAKAQRELMDGLRWEEANAVAETAIYWNIQGGGMDAVNALLRDGNPKAQELVVKRNGMQLWGVLSRLRMLQSTVEETGIQPLVDMNDMSIPQNSSSSSERGAFGETLTEPGSTPQNESPAA